MYNFDQYTSFQIECFSAQRETTTANNIANMCYCERASARVMARLFAYPPVIVDVLERNTVSQLVDDQRTFARGPNVNPIMLENQPVDQRFGTKFRPKTQEVDFQGTFARGQVKIPPNMKYRPITVDVHERFNQKSPGKFVNI